MPAEVLKMATATNAELLAMSGPRNSYPGKPGVVEEGALADVLVVDGDPLANSCDYEGWQDLQECSVCFWHKADMQIALTNVRSQVRAGHSRTS